MRFSSAEFSGSGDFFFKKSGEKLQNLVVCRNIVSNYYEFQNLFTLFKVILIIF